MWSKGQRKALKLHKIRLPDFQIKEAYVTSHTESYATGISRRFIKFESLQGITVAYIFALSSIEVLGFVSYRLFVVNLSVHILAYNPINGGGDNFVGLIVDGK